MTEHDHSTGLTTVYTDPATGHRITWNGSATFNVWNAAGREVNVFTAGDSVNSADDGAQQAAEWWAEYGRESTLEIADAELWDRRGD